jgi:hypothetical protein
MTWPVKQRKVAIKVTRSSDPEPQRVWEIVQQGLIVTAATLDWAINFLVDRYPGCWRHYFACDDNRPVGVIPFEKGGRYLGTNDHRQAESYLKGEAT